MTDNSARIRVSRSGSRMMHGGYTTATALSDIERRQADALIDTLIPPEDGWPPAVELGIADLLAAYLVPAGAPVALYPYFGRDEFGRLLDWIAGPLVDRDLAARVAELASVESGDPELFSRIRDFVYYVYYGHPAVVELIRGRTRYGGDYLGGGQPEGYPDIEGWGDRPLTTRGVFIPTDAVLPVQRIKEQV
jgi:hypothetical protein